MTKQRKKSYKTNIMQNVEKPLNNRWVNDKKYLIDKLYSCFMLAYDPIWYTILMIVAFIYSTIALLNVVEDIARRITIYWYIFDAIYLVDIICTIGMQTIDKLRLYRRPVWLLTLEIVSTIPVELLLDLVIKLDEDTYRYIYTLHTLKIFRIFHYFYSKSILIEIHLWIYSVCFVLFCLYFGTFAYVIGFKLHCINNDCENINKMVFYNNIVSKFTTWGLSISISSTYLELLIVILAPIYMYIARGLLMGMVFVDYYSSIEHKFVYKNTLKQCKILMRMIEVPRQLRKEILNFYDMLWNKRHGYHYRKSIFDVVPEAMRLDIMLDIYCVALRHSILFRDSSPSLMRSLTSQMQQKFYCAGENIYVKGKLKNKLVYIVSGIVQILSEEDDETPLFSLSAGTCIGEACLLISQLCKFTIRCKKFVELQELTRIDFMCIVAKHPEEHKNLLQKVYERYDVVKQLHILVKFFNRSAYDLLDKDHITMLWLKNIMQDLTTEKEMISEYNLYLQEEENRKENMHRYLFTCKYLDLLAMAGKTEVIDCDIIRPKFPYIFHPNSIVIQIWNYTVLICVCYMAIVLPLSMFRTDKVADVDASWLRFCDYVFIFDVLAQLSTAVLTKEGSYTTFRSITSYKFLTTKFKVELIAALPFELFNCILVHEKGIFTFVFLRINRLLKVWRIWDFFIKLEEEYKMRFYIIYYVKLTLLCFYMIFVIGCLFYTSTCINEPHICTTQQLFWSWFTSIQLVTGVGIRGPYDGEYNFGILYNVMLHLSSIVMALVFVYVICSVTLMNPNFSWVQSLVQETQNDFSKQCLRKASIERVLNFIETNWQYNEAMDLMNKYKIYNDLPSSLYHNTIEESYFNILKNVKFFQNLDDTILYAMCSKMSTIILPPNEVVCREGDFNDRLLILKNGICQISRRKLFQYDVINPLVFVYQMPMSRTCITKTHCVILMLKYGDFIRELRKFDMDYESFVQTIKSTIDLKDNLKYFAKPDPTYYIPEPIKTRNFYYFGYDFELDSIEEYEYHVPFDRLRIFKFTRHFLMRFTIHPNGLFFLIYECVRAFLAISSALCHSLVLFAAWENDSVTYILYGLDATAYFDIYVRLHVAYYDQIGILIRHPLVTAKYYIKHSFVIDLLGVFPFEIFRYSDELYVGILVHLNRLLQLYRYCGLMHYIWLRNCKKKSYFFVLHYLPIVIVFLTTSGSIFASITCEFDRKDIFKNTWRCGIEDLAVNSDKSNYLNAIYVQIHSMYMMSSAINTIGINEAPIYSATLAFFIGIATLLGIIYTYITTGILTIYCRIGIDRQAYYQSEYANLKNHVKRTGLKKEFSTDLLNYVDLKWKTHRGRSKSLTSKLYFTLKQDILSEIYSSILENTVFKSDGVKFFRNLFTHVLHESLAKGSPIISYGDIGNNIFIIHRGSVDIFDKYGRLFTGLYAGAMFGSLFKNEYNKSIVESIAVTDVELIIVKTDDFYRHLTQYPALETTFKRMLYIHRLYIPSLTSEDEMDAVKELKSKKYLDRVRYFVNKKTYHPDSSFMNMWRSINFFSSYFSIVAYLYQLGLDEYSVAFVLLQHVADLIYLIDFLLRDHIMYLNSKGYWVKDVKRIKKHRRRNKLIYCVNLLAMLPLDLWIYPVPFDRLQKEVLFKIFRLNRLLRLETLIVHLKMESDDIKHDPLLLDMNFSSMMILLFIHTLACLLLWYAHFFHDTISYNVKHVNHMTFIAKAELFLKWYYMIFTMISRIAQDIYFPLRYEFLLFFIIFMSIAPIVITWIILKSAQICLQICHTKVLFRNKVAMLIFFMDRQNVSKYIMLKTQRYFNMLWIKHEGVIIPELLLKAPLYYRRTYFTELYMKHFDNHKIFGGCSIDFKNQIITQITIDYYYEQDYITYKNLINNSMYFVHEGNVLIYDEIDKETEILIGELETNDCFGIEQGYKNYTPHRYTYKAKKNCVVLCLTYEEWKHLIDFYPYDKIIIEHAFSKYSAS